MVYFLIFVSAIFVNNVVLSQFLGICPFLGVSKKIDTALGMGAAVTFVLTLATIITYLLQMLFDKFGLGFLQTILFLGVAILVANSTYKLPAGASYGLGTGTWFAFCTAIGFALALVLFAGIREQLELSDTPKAMKGTPIALLTAGLLAMAFMGFSGVV